VALRRASTPPPHGMGGQSCQSSLMLRSCSPSPTASTYPLVRCAFLSEAASRPSERVLRCHLTILSETGTLHRGRH